MVVTMKNVEPCLEALLSAVKSEDKTRAAEAISTLAVLHTFYGEGAVTGGDPVPIVPCSLRDCDRDRFVIFYDDGEIATTDSDCPSACIRGLLNTMVSPTSYPTSPSDTDRPPEPPTLTALAG